MRILDNANGMNLAMGVEKSTARNSFSKAVTPDSKSSESFFNTLQEKSKAQLEAPTKANVNSNAKSESSSRLNERSNEKSNANVASNKEVKETRSLRNPSSASNVHSATRLVRQMSPRLEK